MALILVLCCAVLAGNHWLISQPPPIFIDADDDALVHFNSTILQENMTISGIPYFYTRAFAKKKSVDVYRIFLVGEASLSGWPYSEDQAIDRKLRNNLALYRPDRKFELITISVAGLNSGFAADIVSGIVRYSPDLVILYSGHNEFYGVEGGLNSGGIVTTIIPNFLRRLFSTSDESAPIKYDSRTDDLEVLVPLHAKTKMITNQQPEYWRAVERYEANITRIAALCQENNTGLIVSALADNYLLPPVGIATSAGQTMELSADIIFNNARMALQRDGNENSADTLFVQSKELDAFRLRIPNDMSLRLKHIARDSSITIAWLQRRFVEASLNHIPGNDLFVDYIHPNKAGLDIIAAEYTRLILHKLGDGPTNVSAAELIDNQRMLTKEPAAADLQLEKIRIEKTMYRLKVAGI